MVDFCRRFSPQGGNTALYQPPYEPQEQQGYDPAYTVDGVPVSPYEEDPAYRMPSEGDDLTPRKFSILKPRLSKPNFILSVLVNTVRLILIVVLLAGLAGTGAVIGIAKAYMETAPNLDLLLLISKLGIFRKVQYTGQPKIGSRFSQYRADTLPADTAAGLGQSFLQRKNQLQTGRITELNVISCQADISAVVQ